jgi:hypothetical protein
MCGLERASTAALSDYRIYHNYIRLHGGFENITPAEKYGITVDGENKRRRLIQNVQRKWRSMNKLAFEIQNLRFGNKNYNYNSYNTNCFCSRNRDSHWFVCR